MLEADEEYYKQHKEPLFSSHMLDLSEESKEDNIATCAKYFTRMAKVDLWLEMEIGITGGEEDGVDNTGQSHDPPRVLSTVDLTDAMLKRCRQRFALHPARGHL
jgi:fructose/tagatose bisphosphate aldolase